MPLLDHFHPPFAIVICILRVSLTAAEPPLVTPPFTPQRAAQLRQEWAKAAGQGAEFTNSLGMKLVLIPGGRFEMGPNGSRRRVTLRKPYYLGVTEVTLGQYRRYKAGHTVPDAFEEFNADDRPAAHVSW